MERLRIAERIPTSSVGVIIHEGVLFAEDEWNKILLIGRGEYPVGSVSLPAGRVEPGEDDRNAAIREVQEELGLDLSAGGLVPEVRTYSYHPRKGLRKKQVFTHQVEKGTLMSLAENWRHILIPIQLYRQGYDWESWVHVSQEPIHQNPEVETLYIVNQYMLTHFEALYDRDNPIKFSDAGFYKKGVLKEIALWARQEMNKYNSERQ